MRALGHHVPVSLKPGAAPDWKTIGEPTFSRLVEALIRANYGDLPAVEIQVVNGRGGDGGIDVLVQQDGRNVVFQLKYFPEGFDGRWKDRRRQIGDSLRAAVAGGSLDEWVLVYPETATRSGWEYIKTLRARHPDIRIDVWDRAKLDALCGRHSGIVNAIARKSDYFVDEMKALNAERAVLATAEDLVTRAAHLGELAADMDPDWTFDFAVTRGVPTAFLRAKHPRAHEVSPIRITAKLQFGPEDEPLREQAERMFGYGAGDRLEFPAHAISDFTVEGPAWLAPEAGVVSLVFVPAEGSGDWPDLQISLSLRGRRLSTHTGKVTRVRSGDLGRTVTVNFYHCVELHVLLPEPEAGNTMSLDMACNFVEGVAVHDVRSGTRFLLDLDTSDSITFSIMGVGEFATANAKTGSLPERLAEILPLMNEMAVDLAYIQEELAITFPFPIEATGEERIFVRSLALLLRGEVVLQPRPASFDVTFNDAPRPKALDPFFSGQPGQIRAEYEAPAYELFGQRMELPSLALWHPTVRLELDPDATPEAGKVKATDGTPARMFMPNRIAPDRRLDSSLWNLIGIDEPELPENPTRESLRAAELPQVPSQDRHDAEGGAALVDK